MKKYVSIERSNQCGSYLCTREELLSMIDGEFIDIDAESPGTQIILTIVEMEESEFNNSLEFPGW